MIHALPVSAARQQEVRAALEAQDAALESMIREAVLAHGGGGLSVVGSGDHRQRIEVAEAYLHSVEIVLGRPGVKDLLSAYLDEGVYDVEALVEAALSWTIEPEAA